MDQLSIVIPVLNDAPELSRLLAYLVGNSQLRAAEILVVDGGSSDSGCAVAQSYGCQLIHGAPNRGAQLQQGLARSRGEWLWFLHADSIPDPATVNWFDQPRDPCWGRFDVRFTGTMPLLALVAAMMNWRSRITGICTGDQGMFAHRSLLVGVGGVPPQPLMEDIELSKRLKRVQRPVCPRHRVTTSSRRWEDGGIVRTIAGMWWFRLRYWLGADPERLAGEYYS